MTENSEELREIIESCQGKVIHVDNPSIELEEGTSEEEIKFNKAKRYESKKLLLGHLSESCQKDTYKPKNLEELEKKIHERIERKKKLSKLLDKLEEQLKKWAQLKNEDVPKVSELIKQANLPALLISEAKKSE